MNQFRSKKTPAKTIRFLALCMGLGMLASGVCYAQDNAAAAQPQPLSPPAPTGSVMDSGPRVYKESFCYQANVQRVYKPAYTPQVSGQFLQPRAFPAALCVIATPYTMYAAEAGWHFGSPLGFTTGAPADSHALAYERGELGITKNLWRGVPEGMRVVEPLLVPVQPVCRRGGIYIDGGPSQVVLATPCPAPGSSNSRNDDNGSGRGQTIEK